MKIMISGTYVQNFYVSNFDLECQFAYFGVPISNLEIKKKQSAIGNTEVLDISLIIFRKPFNLVKIWLLYVL